MATRAESTLPRLFAPIRDVDGESDGGVTALHSRCVLARGQAHREGGQGSLAIEDRVLNWVPAGSLAGVVIGLSCSICNSCLVSKSQ